MKLIDIYSKFSLPELYLYQLKKYPFAVEAYAAKYYQQETINILEEPLDYLLYNLYELEKLFNLFTNNAIQTEDVKRKNAVFYVTNNNN